MHDLDLNTSRQIDNNPAISPRPAQTPNSLRVLKWLWRSLIGRHESAVFALLVVVCIALGLLTDTFLTVGNLLNISLSLSSIAIAAFGESMVIIIGGVDLSVGAVMALSGFVSALCLRAGIPVPLAIIAGILTGGLVGWANGNLVGRLNLTPFITTLATMSVARGILFALTGGWPVRDLPPGFRALGQHALQVGPLTIPLPVIVMLALSALVSLLMTRTVIGKHIYTLANSERALLVSGTNVVQTKVMVYTLCGILTAIGGLLMTAKVGVAMPTAATSYEVDIIAAAVIGGTSLFGGKGSVLGVLLGAAMMQVLRNSLVLLGLSAHWQTATLGVMLLAFILLDYWRQRKR